MRINTYGFFDKPKLVLINPLMMDSKVEEKIVSKLVRDYFVVVPILSGFYPNSTYSSMQKDELEMAIFFKSHNLNKIDVMVGVSIGGNIAFDFFTKNTDLIGKLFIDSAPLFNFPFLVRKVMIFRYQKMIVDIIKERHKIEEILTKKNKILLYQKDEILLFSDKSIENIINDNYRMKLFNLAEKQQKKVCFVYGSKDKARKARRRLRKYKFVNYIDIKNANHAEFFMKKTNSYIKKVIKNKFMVKL